MSSVNSVTSTILSGSSSIAEQHDTPLVFAQNILNQYMRDNNRSDLQGAEFVILANQARKGTRQAIFEVIEKSGLFPAFNKRESGLWCGKSPAFYRMLQSVFSLEILFDVKRGFNIPKFIEGQHLMRHLAVVVDAYHRNPRSETLSEFILREKALDPFGFDNEFEQRFLQLVSQPIPVDTSRYLSEIDQYLKCGIYTLNNARLAIVNPKLIIKKYNLKISETEVQQLGKAFIQFCLFYHSGDLAGAGGGCTSLEFVDQLSSTVRQLEPFLGQATANFCGFGTVDHAEKLGLAWARPETGENPIAPVASTILARALTVLGYEATVGFRKDLDPTVFPSPFHALIFVKDPSTNEEIVVDPTYKQVLCGLYPSVDQMIGAFEKKPYTFLATPQQLEPFVEGIIQFRKDALNSGAPLTGRNKAIFSFQLTDQELREKFTQVWEKNGYDAIDANEIEETLFSDQPQLELENSRNCRVALTKMKLHEPPVKSFLPLSEELRLKYTELVDSGRLSLDITLQLIEELKNLPPSYHLSLCGFLNIDERVAGQCDKPMNIPHAGYCMAVREKVNPDNAPQTVVYGASGGDLTTPMLMFNPETLFMVDQTPIDEDLRKEINVISRLAAGNPDVLRKSNDYREYCLSKWSVGGFRSFSGGGGMRNMGKKIVYDLLSMGVDMEAVQLDEAEGGRGLIITFPWNYQGQEEKQRTIVLVQTDLTKPKKYPSVLQQLLKKRGVDAYFEKASLLLPSLRSSYLSEIAAGVRPGGFVVTGDVATNGKKYSTDTILKKKSACGNPLTTLKIEAYRGLQNAVVVGERMAVVFDKDQSKRTLPNGNDYWRDVTIRKRD